MSDRKNSNYESFSKILKFQSKQYNYWDWRTATPSLLVCLVCGLHSHGHPHRPIWLLEIQALHKIPASKKEDVTKKSTHPPYRHSLYISILVFAPFNRTQSWKFGVKKTQNYKIQLIFELSTGPGKNQGFSCKERREEAK